MIRIALPYIFNLSSRLEPLGSLALETTPYRNIQLRLLHARNAISELTTSTLYTPYLRASYALAQELLRAIQVETENSDQDRSLTDFEVFQIKSAYEQYKIALLAELGVLHSYFVVQKGGFDSWSLLMFGENLFPSDLTAKVPEALFDAREFGKCLAYENSTAAGFHLFRVLESVLRKYYLFEAQGKAPPKVRNIAVYVNALKQAGKGDARTLFLLKEISDRYRNPLIHPDVVLSPDDAMAIHGLVRTVVTQMLEPLPVQEATTSSPLAALFASGAG